jgi:hypothetical protein
VIAPKSINIVPNSYNILFNIFYSFLIPLNITTKAYTSQAFFSIKSIGWGETLIDIGSLPTSVVCPSGFKPFVTPSVYLIFRLLSSTLKFLVVFFLECITTKDTREFLWLVCFSHLVRTLRDNTSFQNTF